MMYATSIHDLTTLLIFRKEDSLWTSSYFSFLLPTWLLWFSSLRQPTRGSSPTLGSKWADNSKNLKKRAGSWRIITQGLGFGRKIFLVSETRLPYAPFDIKVFHAFSDEMEFSVIGYNIPSCLWYVVTDSFSQLWLFHVIHFLVDITGRISFLLAR
jgi:hypothetical protein